MTEICKTELMSSVVIKVHFKFFDKAYHYFVDVDSISPHQRSWSKRILTSLESPDSEIFNFCFHIHSKVIKHIQKRLKKKTSNLLKKAHYRKLYEAQEGRCYLCHQEMSIYDCTIEHVTPSSKGGKNSLRNKLLAHSRCNAEKGDRMPTDNEKAYMVDILHKLDHIQSLKIHPVN